MIPYKVSYYGCLSSTENETHKCIWAYTDKWEPWVVQDKVTGEVGGGYDGPVPPHPSIAPMNVIVKLGLDSRGKVEIKSVA